MSPATARTTSNRLLGEKSSGTQNARSLKVGGYLLNGLNSEISFSVNCERNLGSSLQKSRMSGMLKSFMARRSSPIPNAQPILCSAPPKKEEKNRECQKVVQQLREAVLVCEQTKRGTTLNKLPVGGGLIHVV